MTSSLRVSSSKTRDNDVLHPNKRDEKASFERKVKGRKVLKRKKWVSFHAATFLRKVKHRSDESTQNEMITTSSVLAVKPRNVIAKIIERDLCISQFKNNLATVTITVTCQSKPHNLAQTT